jgi:hypothetical protein
MSPNSKMDMIIAKKYGQMRKTKRPAFACRAKAGLFHVYPAAVL